MPADSLHRKAVSLCHLKGGTGKTALTTHLMRSASRISGWVPAAVDLDSGRSLTHVLLNGRRAAPTVWDALERTMRQEPIDDLLVPIPHLGGYLLPGDFRPLPGALQAWIPALIQLIKNAYVETHTGSRPVDIVFVDGPGSNRELYAAILSGVDSVAMPFLLSALDMAATRPALELLSLVQRRKDGRPAFLGLIPNCVTPLTELDQILVDFFAGAGPLLPYISWCEQIRDGAWVPPAPPAHDSPSPCASISQQVAQLWEALNRAPDGEDYSQALRQYRADPTAEDPDEEFFNATQ